MQNRYTGDIGDFAKYGLLRALCPGHRLGVAWYLYPDESHNEDGTPRFAESKPDTAQLDFFKNNPITEELKSLDPNNLTPIEALNQLTRLKKIAEEK